MTSKRTVILGSVGLAVVGAGGAVGCQPDPGYPPPTSTTTTTTPVGPPSPAYGCYPAPNGNPTYDIKVVGDEGTLGGLERYDPGWAFGADCASNGQVSGTSGYVYATSQAAADDLCVWYGLSQGSGAASLSTWGLPEYYDCSPK